MNVFGWIGRRVPAGLGSSAVLFMFTGCVKCCTFLFIDVVVGCMCYFWGSVFVFVSVFEVFQVGLLCIKIFHRCKK
jgi:hypothetical protein